MPLFPEIWPIMLLIDNTFGSAITSSITTQLKTQCSQYNGTTDHNLISTSCHYLALELNLEVFPTM